MALHHFASSLSKPKTVRAVVFDVDGVLVDSLTPHLRICQDKNVEYGLNLSIPSPDEFKALVRSGVKISPMHLFFTAVGFSEEDAKRATEYYNEYFMEEYTPTVFPEINEMLAALSSTRIPLGIVTSNVRANVDKAIGHAMKLFRADCVFSKDSSGVSKDEALCLIAQTLRANVSEILYVGDQFADYAAAQKAGTQFLGVSYGWCISLNDNEFPVVRNVSGITKYIFG